MNKARLILFGSFLVAFAAGVSAGLLVSHLRVPPKRPSWLASKLNLTPQQQEQMGRIWREKSPQNHRQARAALQEKRDSEITALLSEEQRLRYDAVLKEYANGLGKLSQERAKAFQQSVEQTISILTPEQASRYKAMLNERHDGKGGPPGGPGPWPNRPRRPGGPEDRPDTDQSPEPQRGEQGLHRGL